MTIHLIDKEWTMCKYVLAIEELVRLHTKDKMANILFMVLNDFHHMGKVSNFLSNGYLALKYFLVKFNFSL